MKKIIHWFCSHKKISFVLLLATLSIIYYFSGISGSRINSSSEIPSLIYHSSIFFLFTFFLIAVISKEKIGIKIAIIAMIISFAAAALDEFHQSFIPMREAGVKDILIDMAGSALSLLFVMTFKSREKAKAIKNMRGGPDKFRRIFRKFIGDKSPT